MALYGATSIARVVPGHAAGAGKNGDQFLKGKGAMATLVRPMAWTKPCAWKPAGAYLDVDGRHDWDDENSTVFTASDPDRLNFMGSLRLARSGAINQGVFTSGSLTSDGRCRVDAFVDSWHCRRLARRSGLVLTAVLEHLARSVRKRVLTASLCRWKAAPPPRRLLRPKLFILLDMRRRGLLHETFTAWALLMQRRAVERGFARRRGVRLLRLLRRREARLAAAGIERWRVAVRAARRLERTKASCFERWRLFVLIRRHNSTWGVERAMSILHRMWLKRLFFDRLKAWQQSRAAARHVSETIAAALLRNAWVSWRRVVRVHRERMVRKAWGALVARLEHGRKNRRLARTHYRKCLAGKHFHFWLEASRRRRRRRTFRRWAWSVVLLARRNENVRRGALLLLRVLDAHASRLRRQAFLLWLAGSKGDQVVDGPAVSLPPPPQLVAAAGSTPRPRVCRCVRCLRKYGHLGGRANQPRSGPARPQIVVTESGCDVDGHLEFQLQSARRALDKGLRMAATASTARGVGRSAGGHAQAKSAGGIGGTSGTCRKSGTGGSGSVYNRRRSSMGKKGCDRSAARRGNASAGECY